MIVEVTAPKTATELKDVRFAADTRWEDLPTVMVNGVRFTPAGALRTADGYFVTFIK